MYARRSSIDLDRRIPRKGSIVLSGSTCWNSLADRTNLFVARRNDKISSLPPLSPPSRTPFFLSFDSCGDHTPLPRLPPF